MKWSGGDRDQPDDHRDFAPASFMPASPAVLQQFGITVSVQVFFSLVAARMVTPVLWPPTS